MLQVQGRGSSTATQWEALGDGTGTGTTVTAGTNTKGTAVSMGTTAFEWNWLELNISLLSGNAVYRLDVVYGVSNTVLIEDIYIAPSQASTSFRVGYPIRVPVGTELKIRLQASAGTPTAICMLAGYMLSNAPGADIVRSMTDYTNTAPTNGVAADDAGFVAGLSPYATMIASTPIRINRLQITPARNGDSTRDATDLIVQVAKGAAASETIIGQFLLTQTTSVFQATSPQFWIPCDVPAGERLAFRVQYANGTSDDGIALAATGFFL